MKCYYELLGVPQNVEQIDLKRAYYKLSLQWHPDKNTTEDTTVIFQDIQEAYKVLSDPHERAWYDKHRAQILQGNSRPSGTSDYQESRVDVFQFFTRSCFDKFDDGPKGFYTVYRKVFTDIAEEEKHAASFTGCPISSSGSDSDDDEAGRTSRSYPSFGSSSSSYAEVVAPFYLFWETFETKKTYTWVEKYDTRFAGSRQERRAMDAENNRIRMTAIRKRNEEVRQLVSYVRKRDKRVIAEKGRIQRAAEEAQTRTQSLAEKARQREATQLHEAWNDEVAFGGIASQWSEQLETELARLEAELDGINLNKPIQNSRVSNHDVDANNPNKFSDGTDAIFKGAQNTEYLDTNYRDSETNVTNEELYCIACDKLFASIKAKLNHESSKKHKKQLEYLRKVISEEDNVLQEHLNSVLLNDGQHPSGDEENDVSTINQHSNKLTKRAKKAERRRKKEAELLNPNLSVTNEQHLPSSKVTGSAEVNNGNDSNKSDTTTQLASSNPVVDSLEEEELPSRHANQSIKSVKNITSNSSKVQKIICDTCNVEFQSRNALFNHLKESGHARLKSKAQISSSNVLSHTSDEILKECKEKKKSKR
ncbi:DnaJ likeubfamily C member 21 [Schistosoma japonicum]|nr:DnaJ likeubfamily C member 21 [Schistosoma japonicum]KAH8873519.1 DnaJ likeubfamily C member 21 [Schistosoma japonicum]KAH8873520.1 DnaJ likeubfamily C member 21 [Schistosoma japonicum]